MVLELTYEVKVSLMVLMPILAVPTEKVIVLVVAPQLIDNQVGSVALLIYCHYLGKCVSCTRNWISKSIRS